MGKELLPDDNLLGEEHFHRVAQSEAKLVVAMLTQGKHQHVAHMFFAKPYQEIYAHLWSCDDPICARSARHIAKVLKRDANLIEFLKHLTDIMRRTNDLLLDCESRGESVRTAIQRVRLEIGPFC